MHWELPASTLHNLVRGATPEPGAWCFVKIRDQKKRLKINRTLVEPEMSGQPGNILSYGKAGLVVACSNQALRIIDLQLEGKKAMSAEELMRGIPQNLISFN